MSWEARFKLNSARLDRKWVIFVLGFIGRLLIRFWLVIQGLIELLKHFLARVEVFFGLPSTLRHGVAFPFDLVLKFTLVGSSLDYLLDFVHLLWH